METTYLGNIKGPRGPQGEQGIAGPGAVPADEAVASYITAETDTETKGALTAAFTRRVFVPLIVFIGESNSGGQGLNSELTAAEKLPRPAVQILNNTTLAFEPLQIGVNNFIDHAAIPNGTHHGWEAGLATSAELGEWADQVYLVKAGQGGSLLSQWVAGGTYFNKFIARFNAAKAAILAAGYVPQVYIWSSMGINDHVAGTTVAAFEAAMVDWIARIRVVTGSAPFILTKLMALRATYNTVIDKLDEADPLILTVRTNMADQVDISHWDTRGVKRIADNLIARSTRTIGQGTAYQATLNGAARAITAVGLPITEWEPIVWTSASGATATAGDGGLSFTAYNQGALGGAIDATQHFELEVSADAAGSNGVAIILDDDNTANFAYTAGGQPFLTGANRYAGKVYTLTGPPPAVGVDRFTTTAPTTRPIHFRIRRQGTDVVYSASNDGGLTFIDIYTHVGILAGVSTVYLKAISALNTTTSVKVAKRVLSN